MRYALLNSSPAVDSNTCNVIAVGLSMWMVDVANAHGWLPDTLIWVEDERLLSDGSLADIVGTIRINETPPQAGLLGEHFDDQGRLQGLVHTTPILAQSGGKLTLNGGGSLPVVIGHEWVEMRGNPFVNDWRDMPDGKSEAAHELVDPCQADTYDYGVDATTHISVPNVVTPRFFDPKGSGPYDLLGRIDAPLTHRPGGYMILRDRATGVVRYVFGAEVPQAKRDYVQLHGRHARNSRMSGVAA